MLTNWTTELFCNHELTPVTIPAALIPHGRLSTDESDQPGRDFLEKYERLERILFTEVTCFRQVSSLKR